MNRLYGLMFLLGFGFNTLAQGSGDCIDFDGGNDVVEITDPQNFATAGSEFAIECWIKSSDGAGTNMAFVTNYGGTGQTPFFMLGFDGGNAFFWFRDGSGVSSKPTVNKGSVVDGNWHHFAGVRSTLGTFLYLDGVLVDSDAALMSDVSYGAPISLMDHYNRYTSGNLDEVRIWTTARTQTEIRDNMCVKLSGTEAGLHSYYSMDGATNVADGVKDDSGNGFDGTMINMTAGDVITSGAPIGNTSTYVYTGAWGGQTITHTSPEGDSFEVSAVSGTPEGYHIYHVNQTPNTLAGTNGVGSNDHYYVVFKTGDAGSTYTGTYFYANNDAFQNSDPSINETQLAMYKRDNNADPTWVDAGGTVDPVANTITATGESTEYILGILGASPLPIELLSFSGELNEDQVDLKWTTASEINNDYFTVERSTDGSSFEALGTVDGAGNSNQTLHYDFVDPNPAIGMIYYRLKQTDFDGDFTYSNVVSIEWQETKGTVLLYPNPTNDGALNIVIQGYKDVQSIQINDPMGRLIYYQEGAEINGNNIRIESNLLEHSGTYFIRINSSGSIITRQVVKN